LLDWDVDALITDRPDLIVPLVAGRRTRAHPRAQTRDPAGSM
jgi:hypothetical protein